MSAFDPSARHTGFDDRPQPGALPWHAAAHPAHPRTDASPAGDPPSDLGFRGTGEAPGPHSVAPSLEPRGGLHQVTPAEDGSAPVAEGAALNELSAAIAASLARRLSPEQFTTWFRRVRLVRLDERSATFAVPNEFAREWLSSYYLEPMAAAVQASLGMKRRVELRVDPEAAVEHGAPDAAATRPPAPPPAPQPHAQPTQRPPFGGERAPLPQPPGPGHASAGAAPGVGLPLDGAPRGAVPSRVARDREETGITGRDALLHSNSDIVLNPRYTFENYVVGPCNRFAHAAAMGSAEHPGRAYNPLFLHGRVGVGKTHLLQALCFMILERQPGARILYLSCETFVNHFINALENGDLIGFREKYRNVDVLVVDDIQLLANKERTQEEFFHTFNTLYNAGKQIVLSSDSPPKDIPTLQDRLVSRFKWGMVTEVSPPCFETRVAIVKRKGRERSREVPDEVAQFIAEHIEENVRELEGAVTRLLGYAGITAQTIDVALARNALADLIEVQRGAPTMDDIIAVVTSHFSVKLSDLQSKRRTNAIAYPRQVAMFLARRITRHSLEEIGGYFGGRDHTTVLYAVDKIANLVEKDAETSKVIGGLLERLTGKR